MLQSVLNRVLLVLFFLSCLNIIRHGYYFIQSFVISNSEDLEKPLKYRLSRTSLILLGISIAYILTTLVTGLKV
jgi:hypothetical protein